jgi:hypothetical protein
VVFKFTGRIENNLNGFSAIAESEECTRNLFFDELIVDFSGTTWFEANLCAALGAVLNRNSENLNTIKLRSLPAGISSIFSKNGFLNYFGGQSLTDLYGTTIPYKSFGITDLKAFYLYTQSQLLNRSDFPKMSDPLKKAMARSIIEIFTNAITHGNCSKVFTCGQFFPSKKRIDFSIVNLGTTIQSNVANFLNHDISSVDAIKWAIQEGNTTRTGSIPGGLGLSILREFIKLNKGAVHIYSGKGYFNQNGTNEFFSDISKEFAGTIVTVEFNLSDSASYRLSTEQD